jgi:plasmid rolling circle replication initiator protein Rep
MNNKIKKTGIGLLDKATEKKLKGLTFEKYIVKHVSAKNIENLIDCSIFLWFLADKTLEKLKLNKGNFCKNRFCPMCAWRRARKDALIIAILMQYIKDEHKKEYIFLTLTTPNVQGFELNDEIKKFNKSFKKLVERKEVKTITKGYIRKLEVTYDKCEFISKTLYKKKKDYFDRRGLTIGDLNPTYNTYNPHFHVIIAVNETYFTATDQYINQDKWLKLWQEATGDTTITQVNVKKIKNNNNKEILEIAKYGAKDIDYLTSQEVFDIFYKALKGKQLITYNGLFKIAMQLFKSGELDKYKKVDSTAYMYMLLYKWGFRKYIEEEFRELTEEELQKLNNEMIKEAESE